jgi:hypothetical protein
MRFLQGYKRLQLQQWQQQSPCSLCMYALNAVCRADPADDAAVILALHKALAPQGVTLTADANRAWSLDQALQFGRALTAAGSDGSSSSGSSSSSDSDVMDCIDSMIDFNSRMDGSNSSIRMLDHYSSGSGSSNIADACISSSSSVLAYIEEPTADPCDMAAFYAETGELSTAAEHPGSR